MRRAYIGVRAQPDYRRDAICEGLATCGYEIRIGVPTRVDSETVWCCWNRYNDGHHYGNMVEKAGGRTIVCENAYVGSRHDGDKRYAIAIGGHNGSGRFPAGGPERWQALGIEVKPWREHGGHILVAPNRSFGRPDMIMPPAWSRDVRRRLEKLTQREIRVRPHPGNNKPQIPLERDLENCWAVVIWSSSVGVEALIRGTPVFVEGPYWCMKGASAHGSIEAPALPERMPHFHSLAWQQWSLDEIASGESFRHLLGVMSNGC